MQAHIMLSTLERELNVVCTYIKKERKMVKWNCFLLLLFIINNVHGDDENASNSSCLSHEPSVVVFNVKGRLGNHIWSFMKGLAVKSKYGVNVQVMQKTLDYLYPFFPNTRLHPVDRDFYPFYDLFLNLVGNKIQDHYRNLSGNASLVLEYNAINENWKIPEDLLHLKQFNSWDLINSREFNDDINRHVDSKWELFNGTIHDLNSDYWRTGKFIYYQSGYVTEKESDIFIQSGFEKLLIDHLRLRDKFLHNANENLMSIKKQIGTKKNVIFVGIHSRRSDHITFEKKIGLKPLKNSYYLKAIRLFRQEFEKKKKSKKNVIAFIFVSDDMEYGRKVLLPNEKNIFFSWNGKNRIK
ncbi:uncharacterized protein [Lepeophtheirus salmonis]|uniref:uncharacterized protein n=1 Tax=Lepeophtheirus salmonis TaxID=72036 RepID=UPI001AE21614|nr:uncharacterized protein LOC121119023 [Lepeophtheirus salmonis]